MRAIGDKADLQRILDVIHHSAMKAWAGEFAQEIVDQARTELLDSGLFVDFDGPPTDAAPSFAELAAANRVEGGCGCAPGTVLCPH
jgi:hypothetical protein